MYLIIPTGIQISIYHCIHVHTCTYQYVLVCTSMYQYIPVHTTTSTYHFIPVCTGMYQYIPVHWHTSTYQYILVCTSMCWHILVHTTLIYIVVPVLRGCSVCRTPLSWSLHILTASQKIWTKPIVLRRLVGAGGRTERDPMKCAVWFTSVPVRTCMYQYVPVCTMNWLNLSSFDIRLCHIVSHA